MNGAINKFQKPKLMGHIIANYPNYELSLNAALGICYGGASYLEVQFPFSDPNADGAVIEEACNKSIMGGFKVPIGFKFLSTLSSLLKQTQKGVSTRLIIMTYANVIYCYGIESFVKKAKKSGVWGMIVPDLPIGYDESLRILAKKYKIAIISLIAPGSTPARIKEVAEISDDIVYVVARAGITGSKTQLDKAFFNYLKLVSTHCKKPIALGFGINSYEQVLLLKDRVDIIVAGTYFVQFISQLTADSKLTKQDCIQKLQAHTQSLMGWS